MTEFKMSETVSCEKNGGIPRLFCIWPNGRDSDVRPLTVLSSNSHVEKTDPRPVPKSIRIVNFNNYQVIPEI